MWSDWITPDWPAPEWVRACVTTRWGGVSSGPYDSLNLGDHVGDHPAAVRENRRRLFSVLELPEEPLWLRQVHGNRVVEAGAASPGCEADASFSRVRGQVCVVMSADCLPLLLCDHTGSCVAALHAGWRGLADGVIEAALGRLQTPASEILAWLGPAIGPDHFMVGDEVRQRFLQHDSRAETAFRPAGRRWLADIYLLARQRLHGSGVSAVYGGGECTFQNRERYFSYRRDGTTGRMASLIWLT